MKQLHIKCESALNLTFAEWSSVFIDAKLTTALLNRRPITATSSKPAMSRSVSNKAVKLQKTESSRARKPSIYRKRKRQNHSDRVGGRITPAVLSHHRTCGSAIRRFIKHTGSAAEYPAGKPAPFCRTMISETLGSCPQHPHSTTGHAR